MLPIGLTAFFKIGGDTNALHSWNYLLPAVLVAWLARDRASTVAPALRVLAVAGFALALNTRLLTSLPSRPLSEHFESARQLGAAYPHALWFPQNPVVGYYTNGELWHSEDGLLTRNLAGYNISVSNFRRFLPPDLKGVVYPVSVSSSVTMSLLPEYAQIVRVPYWTLHTRTPSPVVSP
jgi:hypothetical protein